MRAVIIGGNGFIGGHLVEALVAKRWRVRVYDHSPDPYRSPLEEVEYIPGELGDQALLTAVLPGTDAVFHLASTTLPYSSNQAPLLDVQTNLVDTLRFLETCVQCRVGKVVFLSSGGTVYGIPGSLPIAENHPTNPLCSHGIVKLAIEKYLQLFQQLYGLPSVILRAANPYGRRQNPLGDQGAIAVFLGCLASGKPITFWGDGEIVRDYFHVSDLARACVLAAECQTTDPIFNIGSGQGLSLNQLLEILQTVTGCTGEVIHALPRIFDIPHVVLDIHKAQSQLNWAPTISLNEGIRDTWQWVRSQSEPGAAPSRFSIAWPPAFIESKRAWKNG